MAFTTGDIVYCTSGNYDWYTVLNKGWDMDMNRYTLLTPSGTITGQFPENDLVLANVEPEDSSFVSMAFQLCRDFLQQGHHKPFIEEQILDNELDRSSFERAFAGALSIHLKTRGFRQNAIQYLTSLITGLTDLSRQAVEESEKFVIPLPQGCQSRKVFQLEENGVWDTTGHFTRYCDLQNEDLVKAVNLALRHQQEVLVEDCKLLTS